MKENKGFLCIVFINLFLSLLTVCLSPRLDIITFICFVIVNVIVFVLLILNDKNRENRIKNMFLRLKKSIKKKFRKLNSGK